MLITDAQLVRQTDIGEQQHGSLSVLQQGIGGNGGPQPNTADEAGGDGTTGSTPHQVCHRRNSRISALDRLRQQLADVQRSLRIATDQIGERPSAIHPERPAHLSIGYDSHHPAVPISMKLLGMKSINSSIPMQPRWRRNQHLRSWLIRGDAIRGYSQFIETN